MTSDVNRRMLRMEARALSKYMGGELTGCLHYMFIRAMSIYHAMWIWINLASILVIYTLQYVGASGLYGEMFTQRVSRLRTK